jgi:TonB family protein
VRCGNGIVDDHELCDDGNLRDGDGCSATCWREVDVTADVLDGLKLSGATDISLSGGVKAHLAMKKGGAFVHAGGRLSARTQAGVDPVTQRKPSGETTQLSSVKPRFAAGAATGPAMLHVDDPAPDASVSLCISTTGSVTAARIAKSTGNAARDKQLLAAVRTWRYRPYKPSGTPQPTCSTVTFATGTE